MTDRDDGAVAAHHGGLGRVVARDEDPGDGLRASVGRHGQHPPYRSHLPVERELTHEERVLVGLGRDGARRGQDADGDGDVEGGSVFA